MYLLFLLYHQALLNTRKHGGRSRVVSQHAFPPPWLFLQRSDFAILLDALNYIECMQAAINPTVSHSAVVDTFVKAGLIQYCSVPMEAVDRGGGPL